MNQAALELEHPATDLCDRTGFDIGWDHAHHALVPETELLHEGTSLYQGWMAGRAVFGRRTMASSRATRQWLLLRARAWRQGVAFEGQQVTPHYVAQLQATHCPVMRTPLGGASTQPDAAVIERINPDAACAAGNLVTLSQQAARAAAGMGVAQAMRQARAIEDGAPVAAGLDAAAWWRLAVLRSFATPLPFVQAAGLPLALLPPNRVRLLNAPQVLQALVTMLFTAPGWAARCRRLAEMLPAVASRHDFNLFVGALAPRVLEAGGEPRVLRRALEDAWLHERVQRRWQHFLLSLGEVATEQLLECIAAAGLAGKRTLSPARAQAVEGWALADGGHTPRHRAAVGPMLAHRGPAAPRLDC